MSFQDEENELLGAGIIQPESRSQVNSMDNLTHAVLDDVLYNIIHDIVLKTHREERIARANTAAIIIEQIAHAQSPPSPVDSASNTPPLPHAQATLKPHRVETEAAIYNNGVVYIKGNPLVTTTEIRCSKCSLPRLLHPTDGRGARKPEAGKQYCTRHPFIDKPFHDIYGVPFPKEDAGTTRKKPNKNASLLVPPNSQLDAPESSFESPAPSPPSTDPKGKGAAASVFPIIKCPKCPRMVNVRVFAKHFAQQHLNGRGRTASRAAAAKINGQAASQNGSTPPVSRKGTPSGLKGSPQKRGPGDDDDDDEDDDELDTDDSPKKKKKKRRKPTEKAKMPSNVKVEGIVKKWKSGKVTGEAKALDNDETVPELVVEPDPETEKVTRSGNGVMRSLLKPDVAMEKMKSSGSRNGSGSSSNTVSSPS